MGGTGVSLDSNEPGAAPDPGAIPAF